MLRIGIYAGTFDPIHKGHVSFALEAAKKCDLDKVVFLPEVSPRGKENVSPVAKRIEHIETAIAPYKNLDVALLKAERFTYASAMPELQARYPKTSFTLLVGSDVVKTLAQWKNINQLLQLIPKVVVGLRNNDKKADIEASLQTLRVKNRFSLCFCSTPHAGESSTEMRKYTH